MKVFLDTNVILEYFTIREEYEVVKTLLEALNDRRFKDIEDSCQYELAQKTGCQVLITFNIEDFPISEDSPVTIVTPQEFLLKIEQHNPWVTHH